MAQLIPLPLTISCSSKIQIGFTFLVPAHLGSPGQRAVKWVCVFSVAHCLAPAPLKLRPYGAIHTHVYYCYNNNYSEAEMESDGGISSRLVEWIRSWRGHIIALQQVWQWNMTDAQRLTTILVLHLQKYVSIVLNFFLFLPQVVQIPEVKNWKKLKLGWNGYVSISSSAGKVSRQRMELFAEWARWLAGKSNDCQTGCPSIPGSYTTTQR